MQTPLIYQRVLNHPEFVFPIYFKAKPNLKRQDLAEKLKQSLEKSEQKKKRTSNLDPRQDTVYFDQDFTNGWSKIEAMTAKQIKAGKKGVQPNFSDA